MPCIYCLKEQSCPHRHRETVGPGAPRTNDLPLSGTGGSRESLSTDHGPRTLFERIDSTGDLLCIQCSHVVPRGRDQQYWRSQHGRFHVRRQEAVEITRGLPPGAVRFERIK